MNGPSGQTKGGESTSTINTSRVWRRARWIAAAVSGMALMLWASAAWGPVLGPAGGVMNMASSAVLGDLGGGFEEFVDPMTVGGAARRWQASLPAGPYGQVNLHSGRVLTTLPIVGWSGRGPAASFALYHNMTSPLSQRQRVWESEPLPEGPDMILGDANGDGQVDPDDIDPFIDVLLDPAPTEEQVRVCDLTGDQQVAGDDLDGLLGLLELEEDGPWWTHSYSAHLVFEGHGLAASQLALVGDDGTWDVFTWNETLGTYYAPAGLFVTLSREVDEQSNITGYMLTTKKQEKVHFKGAADGRLDYIEDASGNQVVCAYRESGSAAGKLDHVTDASGRVLHLTYSAAGKLKGVTDPINRQWTLFYDGGSQPDPEGSGSFVALDDPMAYRIKWTYTVNWEIATIYDKEGSVASPPYYHGFTYSGGRLVRVADPDPDGSGAGVGLTQSFMWQERMPDEVYKTFYHDRRNGPAGAEWAFQFDKAGGNLLAWSDPMGHIQVLAYEQVVPPDLLTLMHEPTRYTNALGKSWLTHYDYSGNVLWSEDPLGHRTTFTYDTLNNVTSVTPPGETAHGGNSAKTVQYAYGDTTHPTSPTTITLPAAEIGGDPGVIALEYHDANAAPEPLEPGAWYGLLKKVTDANGVQTTFAYDGYGHLQSTAGGTAEHESYPLQQVFFDAWGMDGLGRVRFIPRYQARAGDHTRVCCPGGCLDWNDNGNLSATCCCCPIYCSTGRPNPPSGPCHPERLGCNRGGEEGEPGGSEGSRGWAFSCGTASVSGELGGPAEFEYDRMGSMTAVTSTYTDGSVPETGCGVPPWFLCPRSFHANAQQGYDRLGRLSSSTLTTDEPTYWNDSPYYGQAVPRSFSYTYADDAGILARTGPDGQVSVALLDTAGRLTSLTRAGAAGSLSADYTYNADNSVATVTYGNGARTVYSYYDNGGLQQIRHEKADHSLILQLEYAYYPDGLIHTVTETGPESWWAQTTYNYDNRNRLVEERRFGEHEYWLTYSYDQGGNRLTKTDSLAHRRTEYHYDLEDPATYGTMDNRLMYYEEFDITDPQTPQIVQRVKYYYQNAQWAAGNPTLIVRQLFEGETHEATIYIGTSLKYNKQGELWFTIEQTWAVNEQGDPDCESHQVLRITEFKGSGRARHVVRYRDPADPSQILADPAPLWSDHDGNGIYGDYVIDPNTGNVVEKAAYLPGIGQMDSQTGEVRYFHSDHLGTLRAVTDQQSEVTGMMTYTAFGEVVHEDSSVGTRYCYAGDSGYEAALIEGLSWLHVGARWYDPAIGRFLERDPIGIRGGLNVYAYVGSRPTHLTDPTGLQGIPTVRPITFVPAPCGPRFDVPNTDESNIIRVGDVRWYDPFGATLAALFGMPYIIGEPPPPKPPGNCWWCPLCKKWKQPSESCLHAG